MQYTTKIELGVSECIALKACLKYYKQYCQEKIDKEELPPYWAHRASINTIQEKLAISQIKSFKAVCEAYKHLEKIFEKQIKNEQLQNRKK